MARSRSRGRAPPPPAASPPARWHRALALSLALVLGAGAYARALDNGFVWDDRVLIAENPKVKDLAQLGELLRADLFYGVVEEPRQMGYYRPLVSASYAFDYRLWGLSPRGFHLTNLLAHLGATALLLVLLVGLGAGTVAAAAGAALFAVHPIHTEAVTWISGRTDVFALFFSLGALCLQLRGRWVLAAVCTGPALLSKESALAVPVAIAAWTWLGPAEGRIARVARAVAPQLVVVSGYLLMRFAWLGVAAPRSAPGLGGPLETLLTLPKAIGIYLGKLAWPAGGSAYLQLPYVHSATDPGLWVGLGACVVLVVALIRHLASRAGQEDGPGEGVATARLGILLLVSFLPISNLVRISGPPDMGFVMAERFLYMPSAAACGLAGLLFARAFARWPKPALGAVAGVLALGAFATAERNTLWHDEISLFGAMVAASPDAELPRVSLGTALARAGRIEESRSTLEELLQKRPACNLCAYDLAWVLQRAGQREQARALYERVVAGTSEPILLSRALGGLGMLAGDAGDLQTALAHFERAVKMHPTNAVAWSNVAVAHLRRGEFELAGAAAKRALLLSPKDVTSASVLCHAGARDEALPACRHALRGADLPAAMRADLEKRLAALASP